MNAIKKAAITIRFVFRHPANKMMLPVFLVFFAAAAAVFFIKWLPAKMAYSSITDAISAENREARRIEHSILVYNTYKNVMDEAETAVKKLSYSAGAGNVSQKINALASSAGLKLSIENQGNRNELIKGYEVAIQDITVTGSYRGLRTFIYGLENMDVFTVLRKVRIDREGKRAGMVKAAIQLALYGKPSQKEVRP